MKISRLLIFVAFSFCACTHAPVSTEPKSPASEIPGTPPATNEVLKKKVTDLAVSSACATAAHGEQGIPPKSYMRGVALSYARAICNPDFEATKIAGQALDSTTKDALALYGQNPPTAAARLQTVYALMIGSAARESSWRWCVGKDPAAKPTDVNGCANPGASGSTCEAGLYQTSYNSKSASSALPPLFAKFRGTSAGCFSAEYKGTTTCSDANMKNWGNDPNAIEFQRLSKECPGFATEYHSIMLRVNRQHYGPINQKKALIVPSCISMFEKIRQAVAASPEICKAL